MKHVRKKAMTVIPMVCAVFRSHLWKQYGKTITTKTGQEGVGSGEGLPHGKREERGWWLVAGGGRRWFRSHFFHMFGHIFNFFHFFFHFFCKLLDFDALVFFFFFFFFFSLFCFFAFCRFVFTFFSRFSTFLFTFFLTFSLFS